MVTYKLLSPLAYREHLTQLSIPAFLDKKKYIKCSSQKCESTLTPSPPTPFQSQAIHQVLLIPPNHYLPFPPILSILKATTLGRAFIFFCPGKIAFGWVPSSPPSRL